MEMNDLRCFLVVAEELHISRAAHRMFLSQPAMSRLIFRVEQTVGTPLFDRSGQRLCLTAAGVAFADDAARILSEFDHAIVDARAAATEVQGSVARHRRIRIGMLFPAAAELTWPIVAAYRSSHRRVDIDLVDVSGLGGEQALSSGRVDVAFLWSPVVGRDVESLPLFQDRFAVLLASGHPLAGRRTLDVGDVAELTYTVTTTMSHEWQQASTLEPWNSRPGHAVHVRTVTDAMGAIRSGAAASIGPTCLARYAPVTGIRYVPLAIQARPLSLLCHRRSDHRPETREFVASATQTARLLGLLVLSAPRRDTREAGEVSTVMRT